MPCNRMRIVTAAVDQGCLEAAPSSARVVAGWPVPRTLATNEVPSGRVSVILSARAVRGPGPLGFAGPGSAGPSSAGPSSAGPGSGSVIRYPPSTG
jgi:hypothetical protein